MRHNKAPDGYFCKDLIVYGDMQKESLVAKGYYVEAPDLHNVSVEQANEFHDKVRVFLGSLNEKQRVQFQWTCNSDYRTELNRYYEETKKCNDAGIRAVRHERYLRYWHRMQQRTLRREQLVVFVTQRVDASLPGIKARNSLEASIAKTLDQLNHDFEELSGVMRAIFGADTRVRVMNDSDHYEYFKRFLNPTLSDRYDIDFASQFSSQYSIQELCWDSGGVGLPYGFYMDGNYHAMFAMKRWPQRTYPGLIHRLTALPLLDYQITVNVDPMNIRKEIDVEQKKYDRVMGDYQEEGKIQYLTALEKKKSKITNLAMGFTFPFQVQFAIRVWDPTETGLQSKCAAIKNAVSNMNSAQLYEEALPASSRKVFYSTWPGWTETSYRHKYLYAEDTYLADLLPVSSTFVGHIAEAEAIYDGLNGNLIGMRTFVGGTPQHTVLLGMSGAGKSEFVKDLLWQTALYYNYTVIIEEGLSYKPLTEGLGESPILIHPDGELIINYLDTQGLPLNQLHLATAVALLSKMIGESQDLEKQQLRQAQIAQYISQLYQDRFNDWVRLHPHQLPEVQRLACAAHNWRIKKMEMGATQLDAYTDLKERLNRNEAEAQEFYQTLGEEEITKFSKEPLTAAVVEKTAYAFFKPHEYPTHSALTDMMFFSRMPEHKKDEIDQIATLLTSWSASGQYGKLFDGITNVSLTRKIAHFELGYIPEQATELKTAVGLLVSGFTRQHIITLPRKSWKRIIFEEVGRFLDVPGGEKIVAESYAQLRKFNCLALSIVQQYSKFKDTRIRPVIMGNSKQFFLMRQFDRSDVEDISKDIKLPETMQTAIQDYQLIEQQPPNMKYSSVCYYSPASQPSLCGTIRNIQARSQTPETQTDPATYANAQ